jgi:hypothetical protein
MGVGYTMKYYIKYGKEMHCLSQKVANFIAYKAITNHKSFSETLNNYLIEKMNEDTAKHLKFVDEAMGEKDE